MLDGDFCVGRLIKPRLLDSMGAVGVARSQPLWKLIARTQMVFLESCSLFSSLDMFLTEGQNFSGLKRHNLWAMKVNSSQGRTLALTGAPSNSNGSNYFLGVKGPRELRSF